MGFTPGQHDQPDLTALEAAITEAARTWEDRFEAVIRASSRSSQDVADILTRYGDAYPAGYRDRVRAR